MSVINIDCIAGMRQFFPDNHFDSIVTDPPYELGFMGKSWDASGIAYSVELWREALRVLKPGGHLLAFSGSRTYHRMVCAIEDAGFEIRDQIMWVYGSGFPKSLDVSKAIDKAAGAVRGERLAPKPGHENHVGRDNMKALRESGALSGDGGFSRPWMHDPQKVEDAHWTFAPATDAARQWQGWGTALKPAHEPIVVARKPLVGTVAANVLAHGTGALNIDGCRVDAPGGIASAGGTKRSGGIMGASEPLGGWEPTHAGRWPANLIHDGSDEVLAAFPQAPGQMAKASTADTPRNGQHIYGDMARGSNGFEPRADAGSAARFFYCAKASGKDRNEGLEGFPLKPGGMVSNTSGQHMTRRDGGAPGPTANHHPTVKPTDLMRYLCRLVTPPGGLVLDPFTGSGSTGKAAALEGFQFIGFELSAEYAAIATARIEHARRMGA